MSAQTKASQLWETNKHMTSIARLQEAALDYSFPAGQAQAGMQMAMVEVPWLLAEIEKLKDQINERNRAAA